MKLTEILESLHRMQKESTKLLFELSVSENAVVRQAVANADLALGNAASVVRRNLCGAGPVALTRAEAKEDAREAVAASRQAAASRPIAPAPQETGIPDSMDDDFMDDADVPYLPQGDEAYPLLLPRH